MIADNMGSLDSDGARSRFTFEKTAVKCTGHKYVPPDGVYKRLGFLK